jgi:hypothetical protein
VFPLPNPSSFLPSKAPSLGRRFLHSSCLPGSPLFFAYFSSFRYWSPKELPASAIDPANPTGIDPHLKRLVLGKAQISRCSLCLSFSTCCLHSCSFLRFPLMFYVPCFLAGYPSQWLLVHRSQTSATSIDIVVPQSERRLVLKADCVPVSYTVLSPPPPVPPTHATPLSSLTHVPRVFPLQEIEGWYQVLTNSLPDSSLPKLKAPPRLFGVPLSVVVESKTVDCFVNSAKVISLA